jgi:hypothetical protein
MRWVAILATYLNHVIFGAERLVNLSCQDALCHHQRQALGKMGALSEWRIWA